MDHGDRDEMNKTFEVSPWKIDSYGITLCHRPRLYWLTWELLEVEGAEFRAPQVEGMKGEVVLQAEVPRVW